MYEPVGRASIEYEPSLPVLVPADLRRPLTSTQIPDTGLPWPSLATPETTAPSGRTVSSPETVPPTVTFTDRLAGR